MRNETPKGFIINTTWQYPFVVNSRMCRLGCYYLRLKIEYIVLYLSQ